MTWIYPEGLVVFAMLGVAGTVVILVVSVAYLVRRIQRKSRPSWRWMVSGALAIVIGVIGLKVLIHARGVSTAYAAIDARMVGAFRPDAVTREEIPQPYLLLRGDLHCHISPPDEAYHVTRDLDATLALAKAEGLDFVVLTPHIWTPLMPSAAYRARILAGHRALVQVLSTRDTGAVMVNIGAESTDDDWGHVGMAFGDYDRALREVSNEEVATHLGDFFTRYIDSGGLLTIHHPLEQPKGLPARFFAVDMSWRPFSFPHLEAPHQIRVAQQRALGVEAYNMGVSEMKDWLVTHDRESSIRDVLAQLDHEILTQQRRMVATGGSDSHGSFLRPVMFVLAHERSLDSVHEAIVQGRTCVRDGAACAVEARKPGEPWATLGASLHDTDHIEIRALASDATILRNGQVVTSPPRGEIRSIVTPMTECSLLRVVSRGGYSSPIYVNCGFAD